MVYKNLSLLKSGAISKNLFSFSFNNTKTFSIGENISLPDIEKHIVKTLSRIVAIQLSKITGAALFFIEKLLDFVIWGTPQ